MGNMPYDLPSNAANESITMNYAWKCILITCKDTLDIIICSVVDHDDCDCYDFSQCEVGNKSNKCLHKNTVNIIILKLMITIFILHNVIFDNLADQVGISYFPSLA